VSYLAHVHEQQRLTVRSNRVAPRRVQGAASWIVVAPRDQMVRAQRRVQGTCRVSAGVYYCTGRRERSDRDTAAASAMMSVERHDILSAYRTRFTRPSAYVRVHTILTWRRGRRIRLSLR